MNIKIYEKPVITKFVMIDGVEFELSELYGALHEISETKEDDTWGEYSLRDYEIYNHDAMKKLVEIGLVKNYTGSRMANLYCMKNEEGINNLLNTLYELNK